MFKENIYPHVESISKSIRFVRIILRRDMDKNSLRACEAKLIIVYTVNQCICFFFAAKIILTLNESGNDIGNENNDVI